MNPTPIAAPTTTDRPVYLDHNATTPVRPEVLEAMLPYLREHFGNPSSAHPYGARARAAVDVARAQVAALLGCAPHEIVFTSGGTESNNLAIHGVAARAVRRHAVTSVVEHPATSEPLGVLERAGWRVDRVGVDRDGRLDLAAALDAIDAETALVTVMLAQNEVGTLQPIAELAASRRGGVLHTDAAQAVGKIPIDVEALGVDLLSVAGHKLYAPKGVGALYVRAGTPLEPFVRGATHERGLRPGTENVASIVGLGEAARLAALELQEEGPRVRRLRDRLHQALARAIPGLALSGHAEHRLPNTLHVRFPGVTGVDVLGRCPEVAASSGSACHDGTVSASAVLLAMGITPDDAVGAVRLSLGRGTTEAQVDRAAAALIGAWRGCAG